MSNIRAKLYQVDVSKEARVMSYEQVIQILSCVDPGVRKTIIDAGIDKVAQQLISLNKEIDRRTTLSLTKIKCVYCKDEMFLSINKSVNLGKDGERDKTLCSKCINEMVNWAKEYKKI